MPKGIRSKRKNPQDRKRVAGAYTALYVRRVPWDVAHLLHQAALDRGTTTSELLAYLIRKGLRRQRRPRRPTTAHGSVSTSTRSQVPPRRRPRCGAWNDSRRRC